MKTAVKLSPNTVEVAADLLFWISEEAATNGRNADAHKIAVDRLRLARADFAAAALADVRGLVGPVLEARATQTNDPETKAAYERAAARAA